MGEIQTKLVSYETLLETVSSQIEATASNPQLLANFLAGLKHGETNPQVDKVTANLDGQFFSWLQEQGEMEPVLQNKAVMHYFTERDLLGPLISHFALSIAAWQKDGKLPGKSVAMLRDFQPFYLAAQEAGADLEPWYLRRAMFCIDDELTPEDEAKIGTAHNGKLAVWLEPLLSCQHLNLLDSGCWGTVVYDMASLRSVVNWLVNSSAAEVLSTLKSGLKAGQFQEMIPMELSQLIDTGLNSNEVSMKWGVLHHLIQDNEFLAKISGLKGQNLTTTALDHYSHPFNDPRFNGHQLIYSHIDSVAGFVMSSPLVGELVNDTIEENKASKAIKGPTKLVINDSGVEVVLEDNTPETKLCALAASMGASHAVQLAMVKQKSGLVAADPAETVQYMESLIAKAKVERIWTGVFPSNTPTWSKGNHFLSNIWPVLQHNPYSTYKPFNPNTGVNL
ncbi:MAG: hypothetical protein UV54_C0018G0005 [Candidatus Beckwithbacteria bacterium GW2011_GWA2_43_10]|uniref:Uncharacterized protein n=1 Tax=Candidatus Beckwithbacteria bacterium GW2011_GWA2_43_10 TaxID=1618369 RepID=A0A0G1C303_9BACT|nr:MAG: hypothetical protein UV54_C0018G0005 [Candidatus Beckwithbacteria bacterium GW2011_GWA2_43_10]